MSWVVFGLFEGIFTFFYESDGLSWKWIGNSDLTKCSECLIEWNISRIPLKVLKPWVEKFFGLFEGILLFLRKSEFCYENESELGFDEMFGMPIEMDISRIPLKVSQTMSRVVFGLFWRNLLFYDLTFCHENERELGFDERVGMPIEWNISRFP